MSKPSTGRSEGFLPARRCLGYGLGEKALTVWVVEAAPGIFGIPFAPAIRCFMKSLAKPKPLGPTKPALLPVRFPTPRATNPPTDAATRAPCMMLETAAPAN